MRNSTKLKELLQVNRCQLYINDDGIFEMIVTNNHTGNSFIATGINFTTLIAEACRDAKRSSKNNSYNF